MLLTDAPIRFLFIHLHMRTFQVRPKGNSNKKKSKKDKVKPIELSPESPDDRPTTLRNRPDLNKLPQKEAIVKSRTTKSDSTTFVTTTTSLNR